MSQSNDILEGIAGLLVAGDVAVFRYDAYTASETGIGFGSMPESCDRAIGITDYATDDDPEFASGVVRVQLMIRGAPGSKRDANDLRDAAFLVLHGLMHVQLGSVHANQINRVSSIPQGIDENRRWECSDNYELDCDFEPTVNRPY